MIRKKEQIKNLEFQLKEANQRSSELAQLLEVTETNAENVVHVLRAMTEAAGFYNDVAEQTTFADVIGQIRKHRDLAWELRKIMWEKL